MPGTGDLNFDLVAFFEPERFNDGGRKADGEAIAPFGNLHADLDDIQYCIVYHAGREPTMRGWQVDARTGRDTHSEPDPSGPSNEATE